MLFFYLAKYLYLVIWMRIRRSAMNSFKSIRLTLAPYFFFIFSKFGCKRRAFILHRVRWGDRRRDQFGRLNDNE